MPFPRKVSRTWPFRKNQEKTLRAIERSSVEMKIAYGLVNIISDAPRVQRMKLLLKEYEVGNTPHVTGSSSLRRVERMLWVPAFAVTHVEMWFETGRSVSAAGYGTYVRTCR